MIRFLNKSVIMLTIVAAFFTVSCEKVETPVVEYLEVNASNLHGNWVLKSINDSPVQDGACFYINFNRSGNEYTIWETMTSIPSTPNVDKGKRESQHRRVLFLNALQGVRGTAYNEDSGR